MEDLTTLKPYANLRFSFYYLLVIKVPKLPDERRLDGIKDRGGLGELWKEEIPALPGRLRVKQPDSSGGSRPRFAGGRICLPSLLPPWCEALFVAGVVEGHSEVLTPAPRPQLPSPVPSKRTRASARISELLVCWGWDCHSFSDQRVNASRQRLAGNNSAKIIVLSLAIVCP